MWRAPAAAPPPGGAFYSAKNWVGNCPPCPPATYAPADVSEHGLPTPNEAFFHRNTKLLGLGRQFGQIILGALGVFLADLSAPILVLSVPCPFFQNQPLFLQKIWDWDLYLGRRELGIQPSCVGTRQSLGLKIQHTRPCLFIHISSFRISSNFYLGR